MMQNKTLFLITLAGVVIAPMVFPTVTATDMLIFGLVAVSTNIMVGYTGMLSFGQASFFGIAAYASGLVLKADISVFLAIPAGVIMGSLAAAMVGYFCVKRTGLYFICLTFAFNQAFFFLVYVWTDVTGGDDGLPGIPRPDFATDTLSFYIFIAVLFFICMAAMLAIVKSPLGLIFRMIRENPERAEAVGYNVRFYKWVSFMIASAFTSFAGTLFPMLYGIVPVDQIHWLKSGDFIFMLLFGGSGNFFGPLIGAVAYIWMSDTFSVFWPRWPILMGAIFMFVVLFMRGGVVEMIERTYRYFRQKRGDAKPAETTT
tara:strand:- start:324 stop:1268 length:945 start_codon:yes stop_codon:yes gene_type:complete